ncbi:hypothetical protein [Pseudomonas putida]|uniref:hypothetical protein n=1 Tax=Pseudomonas putida TaxID=303 RepID=UPI0011AEE45F|nr:hypothetical protein [Pseudomonas putida]
MSRAKVTPAVEAELLTKSKRWCALCFGLKGLREEVRGQIAHINRDSSDSRFDNLVFLCMPHHDQYDSKTSQSKNYTQGEVKKYRDQIYSENSKRDYSASEILSLRDYIRKYSAFFEYIFHEYDDIAFSIEMKELEIMGYIRDCWWTAPERSFNLEIQAIQDEIARLVIDIRQLFEIRMYDAVGSRIRFDLQNFSRTVLLEKKEAAKNYADQIAENYNKLRDIASTHP